MPVPPSLSFNPTVVRLKVSQRWVAKRFGIGFNPTVVRLKVLNRPGPLRLLRRRFNPTVVRLKGSFMIGPPETRIGFNPTVVRLKADESGVRAPDRVLVSIPLWCD